MKNLTAPSTPATSALTRRKLLKTATTLAAFPTLLASTARAQVWPDKPIRFVLSQPAGSGPDNVARIIGERMAKSLGQAVIMDNKPGGQNVIGAQAAARAAADGRWSRRSGESQRAKPSASLRERHDESGRPLCVGPILFDRQCSCRSGIDRVPVTTIHGQRVAVDVCADRLNPYIAAELRIG